MYLKRNLISQLFAMLILPVFADAPAAGAFEKKEDKKPQFCKKSWDENGICKLEFGNGTVLTFDSNKCNDETKLDLRCHGANQKIGDSFAGVKGNYAEGIANAQGVIDQLYAGEWTADREGGAPRLAELAEAIARIKGTDLEKTKAAVEKASDDQRKQWRGNAKVKAMIAQLRAEKAQKALEASGEQAKEEVAITIE
jgi:hypothetical protein